MKINLSKKHIIELIILAAVGGLCLLYLSIRQYGELNYTLPSFPEIATDEFAVLEILSPDGKTLRMEKTGSKWLLPDSYPADPATINKILDALKTIEPVDLVSEAAKYSRYDLDEDNRHTLIGYNKDKPIREVYFGKTSSSNSYNYVLFPDNKNVYTLRGSIVDTLKKDSEDFRDKDVLSINRDSITEIRYDAEELSIMLTKAEDGTWTDGDDAAWEKQEVDDFLGRFTALRASGFPETPPEEGTEIAVITLKGSSENVIELYAKREKDYPAICTSYPFPILISEYIGDAIMETFTQAE